MCCLLVLVQHLVEGVVKLAGDRVDLQLLPDDLVLQLVDPEREGNFVIDAGGQDYDVLTSFFSCSSNTNARIWIVGDEDEGQAGELSSRRRSMMVESNLRWSLVMFISAYSERESDSFSLMFSCLIWS